MTLRMQHIKWFFITVGALLVIASGWFLYGRGCYTYISAGDACRAKGCFETPRAMVKLTVDEKAAGGNFSVPLFYYIYRLPKEGLSSVAVVHQKEEIVAIAVEYGERAITFYKPRPDYWFLEKLDSSMLSEDDRNTYAIILGGLTNDYQLLKKIYQITPGDIHLWSSEAERTAVKNRLMFKQVLLSSAADRGITEVEVGRLRGFAFGRPFESFFLFDLWGHLELDIRSTNWNGGIGEIIAGTTTWEEDREIPHYITETATGAFNAAKADAARLPEAMLFAAAWLSYEPENFRPWEMLLQLYEMSGDARKGLSLLRGLEKVFPGKRRLLSQYEEKFLNY